MTQIIRHTSRTQETITRTVSTVVTNGNATSVNGSDTVGKIGTNEIPGGQRGNGMVWAQHRTRRMNNIIITGRSRVSVRDIPMKSIKVPPGKTPIGLKGLI